MISDKFYIVDDKNKYKTRLSSTFSYDGYELTSWNTSPNGLGQSYGFNEVLNPMGDMNLYAQWKKIEKRVIYDIYSYTNDYSTTTIEDSTGSAIPWYTTQQNNNVFYFTKLNKTGTITIPNAPNVVVQALDGGTIGNGLSTWWQSSSSNATKTLNFTVGEFTKLQIAKLGDGDSSLNYAGDAHESRTTISQGGTLFGGLKYTIHWYDTATYTLSGSHTSISSAYTYSEYDRSFVNVAHRGNVTSHEMHLSVVIRDNSNNQISTIASGVFTGLNASTLDAENDLKNFHTIWFDTPTFDFTAYSPSQTWSIGYVIRDDNSECLGIKFRGRYKIKVSK